MCCKLDTHASLHASQRRSTSLTAKVYLAICHALTTLLLACQRKRKHSTQAHAQPMPGLAGHAAVCKLQTTGCRNGAGQGAKRHLRSFSIKPTVLQVLVSVVFQRTAFVQSALPAIISLFLGGLHALAMYAESCGAVELFACKAGPLHCTQGQSQTGKNCMQPEFCMQACHDTGLADTVYGFAVA